MSVVVVIEHSEPFLDPALRIMEELFSSNRATVHVPKHPEATALVADARRLIYLIDKDVETEIVLDEKSYIIHGKGRWAPKLVTIEFVDEEFYDNHPDFLSYTSTIIDPTEDHKISVFSRNTVPAGRPKDPFAERMKSIGIPIPEERHAVTSFLFYYHGPPYPIRSIFQRPELSKEYTTRRGQKANRYPVSSFPSHNIPEKVHKHMRKPLFWNSRSHIVARKLRILAGHETEESATFHEKEKQRALEELRSAEETCYKLIEARLGEYSFGVVARSEDCPLNQTDMFLHYPLRTFGWLANPDCLHDRRRPYAEALARNYNQNYAKGIHVTAEELCMAFKQDLNRSA